MNDPSPDPLDEAAERVFGESDESVEKVAERTRENAAVGTEEPPVDDVEDLTNLGVDRGVIIGQGVTAVSRWSLRLLIIAAGIAVLWWLLGKVWVGVFPVMLALIVTTVLWPPTGWLQRKGMPPALSAVIVLLGSIGLVIGVFVALVPSLVSQSGDLAKATADGLNQVQRRLSEPPFNIDSQAINNYVDQATAWLQGRAGDIASGVFTGVSMITSAIITLLLVFVLTFFFLKDGPKFLPFLRRFAGRESGRHLTEVLTRSWNTLGGFIRTQAIVAGIDAIGIGIGLVVLQVPLAFALAVLTFFGGFVPILGAFVAGALAVLVALVAKGPTTAILVLIVVLVVQQLESNVLQPILQGKSMELHAGVILLSVAAGSTLFGIVGAFLAVPVAAVVAVIIRYMSEQVDLRAGDLKADDVLVATKDGELLARRGEAAHANFVRHTPTVSNDPNDAAQITLPEISAKVRDRAVELGRRFRRKK
ncbi:AI-2E family transporter [Janibacter sp. GXQ6167]|uniref:AI-2E family transporter n=1 Tax=Janibacter sp. GXQ6167 TaxID=3240791 RepID=UPI0035253131